MSLARQHAYPHQVASPVQLSVYVFAKRGCFLGIVTQAAGIGTYVKLEIVKATYRIVVPLNFP